MMLWLCVLLSRAEPASSIVQLRNMQESSKKKNAFSMLVRFRKVNPHRRHSMADALMQKPSFLGMLNRYGLGEDVVGDVAQQKKEMFVYSTKSSRWYFVKENTSGAYAMLALSKEEIYPEKDPFSRARNETLFDSIRHLKEGCRSFSGEVDGFMRRWIGQDCPYGNVWIEWEPTRTFPMYVLIQSP